MNIIKKYYVRAAFVAMSATSVAGFAACGGFNLVSLEEESGAISAFKQRFSEFVCADNGQSNPFGTGSAV